jgi:hypothetical protein
LNTGGDDIATQTSPALRPRQSSGHGAGRGGFGAAFGRAIARFVSPFSSAASKFPAPPAWLGSLNDWIARQLGPLSRAFQAQRDRELDKLLQLLESNPEEGLRYALPIGGSQNNRGAASPGNVLPARNTDFQLGNALGGGQPADPWVISWETTKKLREHYQRLAEREAQLGRYRRSAYIYAQLLGDLAAAASKLEAGRHFREAGILYRDRLQAPFKAAACFKRAGHFREAVELYEAHKQYEEAGDVWRELGRQKEAQAAYRRAVAERIAADNRTAAADLLEAKLDDPEAALEVLHDGWVRSMQARFCLKAEIALLCKLERHQAAADRLHALHTSDETNERLVQVAETAVEVAESYPVLDVRRRAVEIGVRLIGRTLPDASLVDGGRLLGFLPRLHPGDKLLPRDASRFADQRKSRPAPAGRSPAKGGTRVVTIKEFRLPPTNDRDYPYWVKVVAADDLFFAGAVTSRGIVLLRGNWEGRTQSITLPPPAGGPGLIQILMAAQSRALRLVVALAGRPPLATTKIPANDAFPNPIVVGGHNLSANVFGLAFTESGMLTWVAGEGERFLLAKGTPNGEIAKSRELPIAFGGDDVFVMCVAGTEVLFSIGCNLFHADCAASGEMRVDATSFDRSIHSLSMWPVRKRPLLAVSTDNGFEVYAGPDFISGNRIYSDMEGDSPIAMFKADGSLVAVSTKEGRVYRVEDGAVRLAGSFPTLDGEPVVAVTRGPAGNSFALFGGSGLVRVMRSVP